MGNPSEHEWEVGHGATFQVGADRYAGTIVEVGRTVGRRYVVFQYDHARRVDTNGLGDVQEWVHEPNPNGATLRFTQRGDGRYKVSGRYGRSAYVLTPGRYSFRNDHV